MTQGWSSGMLAAWQARQVCYLYWQRMGIRHEDPTTYTGSSATFESIWSSRTAKWRALPETAGRVISAGYPNNSSGAYAYLAYLSKGASRGAATSAYNFEWKAFQLDVTRGRGSTGGGLGHQTLYAFITSSKFSLSSIPIHWGEYDPWLAFSYAASSIADISLPAT